MTRIELLRKNFQRVCNIGWDKNLAGAQRVWFAVYEKEDERKLRLRLGIFEEVAYQTGHPWQAIDLSGVFAEWMAQSQFARFAESYFAKPSRLGTVQLTAFTEYVAQKIRVQLDSEHHSENSLLAIYGIAGLFALVSVSNILRLVEPSIRGRLLVFFPGVYEQDNYRLLDARDGWNYHAVPITASEPEIRK